MQCLIETVLYCKSDLRFKVLLFTNLLMLCINFVIKNDEIENLKQKRHFKYAFVIYFSKEYDIVLNCNFVSSAGSNF